MGTNVGFVNACMLSVFCILIVFIVLIIVSLSVNLIRILVYKFESLCSEKENPDFKVSFDENQHVDFENVKDKDILVTTFAASIDTLENRNDKSDDIKGVKKM